VACQSIAFGRGVCGTAAKEAKTQVVEDVDKFPGHIACDGKSRSEIVVPVVQGGKVSLAESFFLGGDVCCVSGKLGVDRSWLLMSVGGGDY